MHGLRRVPDRVFTRNKEGAMKAIDYIQRAPLASIAGESVRFPIGMLSMPHKLAMALAMTATLVSLGMAMLSGWQSSGLFAERGIRVALVGVAVLFVHWLPMGWSALRGTTRVAAIALWTVATTVVLYGQVTFFMVSQRHAADLRAAAVPVPVELTHTHLPPGRSRTEIAKATAKVRTELVRAQTTQCIADCQALMVRRARLAAEITALNAEADEAQRRQTIEDRRHAQAERTNELRAMERADPVAFPVASWLGVSEQRVELTIGLAYAVVLEGAAVVGWLLVSVALGRAVVVSDETPVSSDFLGSCDSDVCGREAARERDAHTPGRVVAAGARAGSPVMPEDDPLLRRIHSAVVSGQIKPTQAAIRVLLRCGQRQAGSLSRAFRARFGSSCCQGRDVPAAGAAAPAVADG